MSELDIKSAYTGTPPIEHYSHDNSFSLEGLGYKRSEIGPLRCYLKSIQDSITAYWCNYPLLLPKDIPEGLTQAEIRQSLYGKSLKPDLIILHRSNVIRIVELTTIIRGENAGQLLHYAFLYHNIYHPNQTVKILLLGDELGYQMEPFLNAYHVKYLLLQRRKSGHCSHWIEQKLGYAIPFVGHDDKNNHAEKVT